MRIDIATNKPPVIEERAKRQAREKLAALKRHYGREIPFDIKEVFDLIEQAGLVLPL